MLFNKKTSELFIYEPIGAGWFDEGITASGVIEALDEMGGKRVTVRINSPGGVADEGIAIYNALRRYPGGVDTVVDSLAASAASIVALAGDTRTTADGGRWMIHRAMTIAIGNSLDMQKVSGTLDVYDRSLAEIYSLKMAKPQADVMDLMTAETWYTGDEAIAAGLSTGKADTPAIKPNVAAWFKNPPAAYAAKMQGVKQFAVRRQAAAIRQRQLR